MDRGAVPKFVAEDMMVMSDYELHKCCKFYGVMFSRNLALLHDAM